MTRLRAMLPLAVLVLLGAGATAHAGCPQRLGINHGDTLDAIARACGISVERLRGANPGLSAMTLQAGSVITVPPPALPSPQLPIGRQTIKVAPPLVPNSGGASASSTVIAPPPPPVIHRYDIPGLDDRSGQWPSRPGYLVPKARRDLSDSLHAL